MDQSKILLYSKELRKQYIGLTLSQTSPGFYVSAEQSFESTVGKGEIAHNEQFLLFPVFSTR